MKFGTKTLLLLSCVAMALPVAAFARTINVYVDGMSCGACAVGVKAALETLPEVASAKINVHKSLVEVTLKDINGEPSVTSLTKAIDAAGYTLSSVDYK